MNSIHQSSAPKVPPWLDLLAGTMILAAFFWLSGPRQNGALAGAVAVFLYSTIAMSVITRWPRQRDFGWANRVTLLRGCIVIVLVALAAAMAFGATLSTAGLWCYAVAALLALILDGVDGQLARRTNSASEFGARFDMELDALFILGLCLAVVAVGKAGIWLLALGLMRYGFVAASWALPWMNQPLPESLRRKTVCVWQIVTLMVAIVPPIPALFASVTLATALLLLSGSFFVDVYWLYQRRHRYETA